MKITAVEARVIGNPWKNWVLVKIGTDEGLTGWGDATTPMTYRPVLGAIEEIRPLCLGKDPREIERLWELLYTTLYLPDDGDDPLGHGGHRDGLLGHPRQVAGRAAAPAAGRARA